MTMKEYQINNAMVKIHGTVNQEKVKEACLKYAQRAVIKNGTNDASKESFNGNRNFKSSRIFS